MTPEIASQIDRIKQKLQRVRKADPKFERSCGAEIHQYRLGAPLAEQDIQALESEYGISLPEHYRLFLTHVGGYVDAAHNGAGPHYGLYPLDEIRSLHEDEEDAQSLRKPCVLFPEMNDLQWEEIRRRIKETDGGNPYHGMLEFGYHDYVDSLGIMLILNGRYQGRIMYVESYETLPNFAFETNFLDWYEHWLDEILAGYDISCFGLNVTGNEHELIRAFHEAGNEQMRYKKAIISSFCKFPELRPESLDFLESLCRCDVQEFRCEAVKVLTKCDYSRAKAALANAIAGPNPEKLAAMQVIVLFAQKHYDDWTDAILSVFHEIQDESDGLDYASIILGRKKYIEALLSISEPSPSIRTELITNLGYDRFRPENIEIFYNGLNDPSPEIVEATLHAVHLITEPGFLVCFEKIMDKYAAEYVKRKDEGKRYSLEKTTFKAHPDSWEPLTVESRILVEILSCLSAYGPIADALLEKAAALPHEIIATLAQEKLEKRRKLREKRRKQNSFWGRLSTIFFKTFFAT